MQFHYPYSTVGENARREVAVHQTNGKAGRAPMALESQHSALT